MIGMVAGNVAGFSVANEKHYDVWGKVRFDGGTGSSGQILNPDQRHCGNLGHKYDSTNSLVYMRARNYEAETGRFTSEDPAEQWLNWFAYCHNTPTQGIDPIGNLMIDPAREVGLSLEATQRASTEALGRALVQSLIKPVARFAKQYAPFGAECVVEVGAAMAATAAVGNVTMKLKVVKDVAAGACCINMAITNGGNTIVFELIAGNSEGPNNIDQKNSRISSGFGPITCWRALTNGGP